MSSLYDLIVIGGGPAGCRTAQIAAQNGMKTLLFERNRIGGICLHSGCIPTKSLLFGAKMLNFACNDAHKYGIVDHQSKYDIDSAQRAKNKAVRIIEASLTESLAKLGVEVISSQAKVAGCDKDAFVITADGSTYKSRRIMIACGSSPVVPPISGVEQAIKSGHAVFPEAYLNSAYAHRETVIVGCGATGLELAYLANATGSKVTVIDDAEVVCQDFDREIISGLLDELGDLGISIIPGANITRVSPGVIYLATSAGEKDVSADVVILAAGRRASLSGLGLESVSLPLKDGAVAVDARMRTQVPGIYAAGDAVGRELFAHTAYREAEVAVNDMIGKQDSMDYGAVPRVIYTEPEAAGVGYTLTSAQAADIEAVERSVPMRRSGRFIAENDGKSGVFKMVLDRNNTIIGVHALGHNASELIAAGAMMVALKLDVGTAKKVIFPHPSYGELISECLID